MMAERGGYHPLGLFYGESMDKISIKLHNPQQGYDELKKAWEWCKANLIANHKIQGFLQIESKSREQEEKYHAMIGEIAKQASHIGAKWTVEDWKRLLLDKFARETNRTHGKVIPNLDKTGVVEVGIQSRKFSVKDATEFIEWLHAWSAENGITHRD